MNERQLFLQNLAQTSDTPLSLNIKKAEGIHLFDENGKIYIDFISGIGVSSLGHCHPNVVQAVRHQAEQYMHTMVYGEYVLTPQVELAKRITDTLPAQLDNVYLVNSGAEAVECAMKLAKRYTGRAEIIACKNAYHGSTQGASSLMHPTTYNQAFRPLLPGITHIEFNNFEDIHHITQQTAAVILEPIQAEAGVIVPNYDWMKFLRKRCSDTNTLLIFDEIQTGIGRTGTLWAFQQLGVIPDVLLSAKGLGGGMPIGACISSKQIMSSFMKNPILGHITTFGGHPVTAAAAVATLDTLLKEESIIRGVKSKADLIVRRLRTHPIVKEVRSAGLLIAVDIGDFDLLVNVIKHCLANGLIVDWFLFNEKSIRIAPPLIITEEQLNEACDILIDALNVCASNKY